MAFYMGKGKYPYSALNSSSLNCVWICCARHWAVFPAPTKGQKEDSFDWTVGLVGDRESAFLKVIQYLDFITVKVDNTFLNKYLVEKQESMFKDITEIAGNFVLIPSQNSYEDFLMKPIPVNQTAYF